MSKPACFAVVAAMLAAIAPAAAQGLSEPKAREIISPWYSLFNVETRGDVKAIQPNDPTLKIPHMGWNTLNVITPHALLANIKTGVDGLHAYFVHSFHLATRTPGALVAETDYGGPVTAMVGADNIAGTQFHPEKSQTLGLRLIANFLKWQP